MEIPLCCMISMQVVRPTLMNDISTLGGDFYLSYHARAIIFYVSLKGVNGCIVDVTQDWINSWDDHYKIMNEEFEAYLQSKPSLYHLVRRMSHVWYGNHRLRAWYPYINEVHAKNKSRHVQVTN